MTVESSRLKLLQSHISSGTKSDLEMGSHTEVNMDSLLKMFSLVGKTAVITGGTRGIGQAMAIAFAEAGADIVLIQVCNFIVYERETSHTDGSYGVER